VGVCVCSVGVCVFQQILISVCSNNNSLVNN